MFAAARNLRGVFSGPEKFAQGIVVMHAKTLSQAAACISRHSAATGFYYFHHYYHSAPISRHPFVLLRDNPAGQFTGFERADE